MFKFYFHRLLLRLFGKTCKHKTFTQEPPTCSYCGHFICVYCKIELAHPIGICGPCCDKLEMH